MADYVVRMTGQDNLSGTIKQVKSELNDLGKTTSKLDQIDAKFNKITQSTVGVKRELRDLKNLGSQIKFDGDYNAGQLLKIAKAAGEAKDSMDDFQSLTNFFADDRRWLNFSIQGFQALAGAGNVAAGALSLFGVEQEKVNQAIMQCQAWLSILNGIKSVAILLDKEGYIQTGLRVLGLQAEAAAETEVTAATNAATGAQIKNNAAVKANPYVLAAAAVVALVAGMIALGRSMDDTTEKQEELNRQVENHKEAVDAQNQILAENIIKFKTLQSRWNALGNDLNAKKKFIVENKNEFNSLGQNINTVSDAELAFNKNAPAIIAAMKARARATAAQAEMVKNLQDEYAELSRIEEKIKKGESISRSEAKRGGVVDPDKDPRFELDESSLWFSLERKYKLRGEAAAESFVEGYRKEAEKRAEEANKNLEKAAIEAQEEAAKVPFYSPGSSSSGSGSSGKGGSSGSSSGSSGSDSSTNNDKKGLINDYEKKIQELQEKVNSAETEEALAKAIKELNDKEKEFTDFKIRVGLEVDPKIKDKERAEKKAKEQAKTLYENFQNTMNEVAGRYSISTFDKLIGDNPFNTNSLEGLRRMIDATEGSLQKLKKQKKEFEDAGKEGSDAYQQIIDKIKELEEELAKLGILVIKTSEEDEALKRKKRQIEAIGDSIAALGSIMSSLGQMTDDKALNAGAIIAQAIATYILGWSEATAKAAAAGPLGWVAFGLSTAAQLAAMIAQIHSLSGYASGGIISGGSYYGDQILARVNAGEMVLNRKQQSNLFRAIESGNIGAGQTVLVPEFKIKGSDLYGTLRNFSKSVGKTGKVTGIR